MLAESIIITRHSWSYDIDSQNVTLTRYIVNQVISKGGDWVEDLYVCVKEFLFFIFGTAARGAL